jgi:CDP-diacylglycerol--glycerol-3-phosphate 3-phosphatidyltransferase
MNLGPFMTLPNMMSLARVAIVPFFFAALAEPDVAAARPRVLLYLAIAFVSDWFDGRIARWTHHESGWGRVLDPLADKVFIIAGAIALVMYRGFPLAVLVLLVARDVAIVLLGAFLVRRGAEIPSANMTGKIAMCVFSVALLAYAIPIDAARQPLLYATVAFVIASTVSYARRFLAHRRVSVPSDARAVTR